MSRVRNSFAAALCVALSLSAISILPLNAQTTPAITPMTPEMLGEYNLIRPEADFIRRVIMVPMRDGTKLFTVVVMKKGTRNAPILLSRTPYNADKATSRRGSQSITQILPVMDTEFVNDNYIRVYQDIRGRNHSEGDFIMNRPLRGPLNNTAIDEATDAYDTIDYLVKNTPESNGKVGIIGSSYLGFTSLMATINPHPALKAAVPQSPMVDGWIGDDWFHNGAFRNPNIDYAAEMTTDKGDNDPVPYGSGDDYLKYLSAGSTGDFARKWGMDKFPFVQKIMQNPSYSRFWSLQAVDKWMAAAPLKVPTMLVVGQWDQEDSYGAPAVYKVLESKDTNNDKVHLVIGPWRHSGVNYDGSKLGALNFNGDTALEFRTKYLKPFFDYHLKGGANPNTPPVLTYATGANKWNTSQSWPLGNLKPLYLGANGSLGFTPSSTATHEEYISDPAKPIPFVARPIHLREENVWKPWLVADQRFVADRTDVLVYETPVLTSEVHIMGAPMVDLFAATTGTDADYVVKLIDVYPEEDAYNPTLEGHQLAVGLEIFRGRYVDGFDRPRALVAGKTEHFHFGLPNVDHVFKPGHKIMVQVQSTLFPLYDRNPQNTLKISSMPNRKIIKKPL